MPDDAANMALVEAQALVDDEEMAADLRLLLKDAIAALEETAAGRADLKAAIGRLRAKDEEVDELAEHPGTGISPDQLDAARDVGVAYRTAWEEKRRFLKNRTDDRARADEAFNRATAAWQNVRDSVAKLGDPDPMAAQIAKAEDAMDAALGGMRPPVTLALARIAEAHAHAFDYDAALDQIEQRDPAAGFPELLRSARRAHEQLEAAGKVQREAVQAAGAAETGGTSAESSEPHQGLAEFEASLTESITEQIKEELEELEENETEDPTAAPGADDTGDSGDSSTDAEPPAGAPRADNG